MSSIFVVILTLLGVVVVAAVGYVVVNIIKKKKVELHASADHRHARVNVRVGSEQKINVAMGEAVDTYTGHEKYALLRNLLRGQHLRIWTPSADILIDDAEILYIHTYKDDEGATWPEYQIRDSAGKTYSMEVSEEDGEFSVSLSQKRKMHALGDAGRLFRQYWEDDRDRDIENMEIPFEDRYYYYCDDFECRFNPDERSTEKPCSCEMYEFETEDERQTLTIENWDLDEGEFTLSAGHVVEMGDITVQPMDDTETT